MSHYWNQKPENALNRAKELLAAGRKEAALQILSNVLVRKNKGAKVWQPELESVTHLYLEVCVEGHDHHMAKDGLHQFRSICQISNMHSALEDVIRVFMDKAIARTKKAQEEVDAIVAAHEASDEPESLESRLIREVNGYDIRERTEKELLFPWLKFMWESFRAVLELIKNKCKMENLYKDATKLAMEHCITYKRTTEFRRLNDLLRSHLMYLNKYPNNQGHNTINLAEPEIQTFLLETRFELLNAAMRMASWQEAFKCIEDIHGLIVSTKMVPVPTLMASYYDQLANLFWRSKNYLFHAYALLKFFQLSEKLAATTEEELKELATRVAVAAMAVPLSSAPKGQDGYEFNSQQDKSLKYASLLGHSSVLTRSSLFKDLVPALALADEAATELYKVAETGFSPLTLCATSEPIIAKVTVKEELTQYGDLLKRTVFMKFLRQLARVYQTISLEKLKTLAKPLGLSRPTEVTIVELNRERLVQARLNHQSGSVGFSSKVLEPTEVQSQLSTLSARLSEAAKLIKPDNKTGDIEKKRAFVASVLDKLKDERRAVIERKAMIETEKETQQNIEQLKARLAGLSTELRIAKAPKIAKQAQTEAQPEVIKPQTIKALAATLPPKTPGSIPVEKEVKEETVSKEEQDRRDAEKANQLRTRLDDLAKRMDYLERAKREEEAPLLEKWYEKHREEARKIFEEDIKKFEERQKLEHKFKLQEKARLAKVAAVQAAFEEELVASRRQRFEEELERVEAHNAANLEIIESERRKMKKQILERRAAEAERRKAREAAEKLRREEYEASQKRGGLDSERSQWGDASDDKGDLEPPPSRFGARGDSDRPRFGGRSDGDRPRFGGSSRADDSERPRFGGSSRADDSERPRFGARRDDGDRPRFGGSSRGDDSERPRFGARRDDGDRPRFGGSSRGDDSERPRFGGRRDDGDRPRFGGSSRGDDSERPRFGARRDDGDRPRFGGSRGGDEDRPRFGGRRDDGGDGPRFGARGGDSERPRFGGSRREDDSGRDGGDRWGRGGAPRGGSLKDRLAERKPSESATDSDGFTQVGRGRRR